MKLSTKQLTYIANVRLPTEKAHGIQIIKMCDAFAANNLEVTLLYPNRWQINSALINQNIHSYYQVKRNFATKSIWNLDFLPLHQIGIHTGPIAYWIQELSFAVTAILCSAFSSNIYTRSKIVAVFHPQKTIFEAHDSVSHPLDTRIARRSKYVVCITKSIENSWQKIGARTIYSPDGVGEEFFQTISQPKARKLLKLPVHQKIVLYTGNLYAWKGIPTIINAAKKLSNRHFYIVGGSVIDKNIEPLRRDTKKFANIHIIGHRPYKEIPTWLGAADVLVLPNSAKTTKGNKDTSPLKLFEYLASGKPIIASNVPSLTQILSPKEATFFAPDNATRLADAIEKTFIKKIKAFPQNRKKALQYTWIKRANSIIKRTL